MVKKGWCNESPSTINLKNNEIFTKGLPKKLKDFAHKRQVKHVSILLEPSIPFHTLVRHVDSEDIANEKIRTNDLALEINKVSIDDENSHKESEQDHIMVTQSDPNNKSKPAYKNIVHTAIKTITVYQTAIKNNATTNINEIEIKDPELLNNHLYNTSVVNLILHKKVKLKTKTITLIEIMIVIDITKIIIHITKTDIEVIVEIILKITIDPILDKDTITDLQAPFHLDLDTTIIIKEELHPDLHIDHPIETIQITDIFPDQGIDLVLNHKEIPSEDIITRIDLHLDQETIDQDREHLHKIDNKTE